MNIFLPHSSFEKCAEVLDDRRLVKQILECKQILTFLEKRTDINYRNPYLHHPVILNYVGQEHHIVEYALAMCKEFAYRFEHHHSCYEFFIHKMTPKTCEFSPIFVKGSKNSKDAIREKDRLKIYKLFRQHLKQKWLKDISKNQIVRWTNRKMPNI